MDMTKRKAIGWTGIALTAVLMIVLRWSHIGVTHYNWFLVILIGWTGVLMAMFRCIGPDPPKEEPTEKRKGV